MKQNECDFKGYRDTALANGADEFILKDEAATELLPAIRRLTNS